MAITNKMARLILIEHKYRPIKGEVLLLGRQTIFMSIEEAKFLLSEVGVPLRADADITLDKSTMGRNENFITDKSFFSLFTDALVSACDVSDYEGAEHIFDLSREVPVELINRFDFIYNGSVFDNVFDPAGCMRNVSKMLKAGGVVFHYEGLKHAGSTYLKFTPEWFFDYYSVNQYDDCQVSLLTYHDYFDDYNVIQWDAYVTSNGELEASPTIKIFGEGMVVCVAQKGVDSTEDKNPIQYVYRQDNASYLRLDEKNKNSLRRKAYEAEVASLTRESGKKVVESDDVLFRFHFKVKRKIASIYKRLALVSKETTEIRQSYPHEFYTLGHKTLGIL